MKNFYRRSLLVLASLPIVASFFAASASAQWVNVAPKLIAGANVFGAMQFRDGVVWAGGISTLWSSTDTGKSWKQSLGFPSLQIWDIAFFDKMNGLVATTNEILVTKDGGKTWRNSLPGGDFRKVGFNGSASIMHAVDYNGSFYTSTDGGLNWSMSPIGIDARSFAIASNGTIYLQTTITVGKQPIGVVSQSTDLGHTWSAGGAQFQYDCFTLSVDSCDPERLYLVNEQLFLPTDPPAKLYLSLDGGQNWQIADSHASPYYSGTLTTTSTAIFAGTVDSATGSLRSMDKGATWQTIGGPPVFDDTRNIAAINANIVLATDPSGSIWRTTNGGGDSLASAPGGTLSLAPDRLFDSDTVGCDSVMETIQALKSGCPAPWINSVTLAGIDSSSFRIESLADDSISVVLLPGKPGAQKASLIANLDNGASDTVQLGGFIAKYAGTVALSPDSLFADDTLHCDSLTLPIYMTPIGCHPPPIARFLIAGKDSDGFHIADSSTDSISVEWSSQEPGPQQAYLIAVLANGARDSVALAGYSTTTPLVLSVSPQRLFQADSLYVNCDPAPADTIRVSAASCIWPHVKSERIVGADSMDYTISNPISSTLGPNDSAIILFTPSDTGLRAASYELRLDNDTIVTIPLMGVGLRTNDLSIDASSLDAKTDTIGGDVAIPIKLDGLVRPENVEVVLHYPVADLVYDGSFDRFGTKVDIPGEEWPGRSKLLIRNDMPGTVAAYAQFNVFSDTAYNPQITFDSLEVPTSISPCEYLDPPAATATIYPLQGCGIQMLSHWVHFGERPVFGIRPNPTSGDISITSSINIGNVSIEVYDMLGMECGHFHLTLSGGSPQNISLPFEGGLYYVRIISEAGASDIPIIIKR